MPLSIIECIYITESSHGSRVKVTFEDAEEMTIVVAPSFPIAHPLRFGVDMSAVTPKLKQSLTDHFDGIDAVTKHLAAVRELSIGISHLEIVNDITGFDSPEIFTKVKEMYYRTVIDHNWAPVYVSGLYGSSVITIDDQLVAAVGTPVNLPVFSFGKMSSLEPMPDIAP